MYVRGEVDFAQLAARKIKSFLLSSLTLIETDGSSGFNNVLRQSNCVVIVCQQIY